MMLDRTVALQAIASQSANMDFAAARDFLGAPSDDLRGKAFAEHCPEEAAAERAAVAAAEEAVWRAFMPAWATEIARHSGLSAPFAGGAEQPVGLELLLGVGKELLACRQSRERGFLQTTWPQVAHCLEWLQHCRDGTLQAVLSGTATAGALTRATQQALTDLANGARARTLSDCMSTHSTEMGAFLRELAAWHSSHILAPLSAIAEQELAGPWARVIAAFRSAAPLVASEQDVDIATLAGLRCEEDIEALAGAIGRVPQVRAQFLGRWLRTVVLSAQLAAQMPEPAADAEALDAEQLEAAADAWLGEDASLRELLGNLVAELAGLQTWEASNKDSFPEFFHEAWLSLPQPALQKHLADAVSFASRTRGAVAERWDKLGRAFAGLVRQRAPPVALVEDPKLLTDAALRTALDAHMKAVDLPRPVAVVSKCIRLFTDAAAKGVQLQSSLIETLEAARVLGKRAIGVYYVMDQAVVREWSSVAELRKAAEVIEVTLRKKGFGEKPPNVSLPSFVMDLLGRMQVAEEAEAGSNSQAGGAEQPAIAAGG